MASSSVKNNNQTLTGTTEENVSVQLPAPLGWTKKLMPKKGVTSKVKEIIFIAPTGEEMRNRKQLIQYLKFHPGGPEIEEFYWGTGEAPRRSSRISEKPKVATESKPPNKLSRKLASAKKDNKEADWEKEVHMDNTETTEKEKEEAVTEESEDAESSTEMELAAPQVNRVRVHVKVRIEAKEIQK